MYATGTIATSSGNVLWGSAMIRFATAFIILLTGCGNSLAFEVGDTVVVIHATTLKVDQKTVDQVWVGLSLKVRDVNLCDWLCPLSLRNGHPGWLESKHAVLLEQGIPLLTDLIRRNPQNADYYNGRAEVWRTKKDFDKALSDCNEAIRLSPSAATYSTRGTVWAGKEEYDKAISDYSEAIRLEPEGERTAFRYSARAAARRCTKDYDKALADLNMAIQHDSTHVGAYVVRGMVRNDREEYDLAMIDLNEAIRLDQKCVPAYEGRAFSWSRKNESSFGHDRRP